MKLGQFFLFIIFILPPPIHAVFTPDLKKPQIHHPSPDPT